MEFLALIISVVWYLFVCGCVVIVGGFILALLFSKDEQPSKKETVMGPLPKVDPNSFAAKWSIWMTNDPKREDIPGTDEYYNKYQPKA
jgi:hypothetical protein